MSWCEPVYDFEKLEEEWTKSLSPWLNYISAKTDEELLIEITFDGLDIVKWAVSPKDFALQINFHGIEPDFIDYIGTKYKKVD